MERVFTEEWNVFCPTGEGGGIDATCSPGESGGGGGADHPVKAEKSTPPPPGKAYQPNVEKDGNHDGVTDAARVGVPAHSVPPPPKIDRLPNLTPHERQAEESFASAYEAAPDKMASNFRELCIAAKNPPEFGTDDAKCLTDVWSHPDPAVRAENRATLNTPLHATANAIAKRAFVQHLDSLKKGDEILVTVGGCGAGKGYALKNVPEAKAMRDASKAVWDSAGDQNATENPWVQAEAEKRGLKVNYVYVHADPKTQWADPGRGVLKRAADPSDGRMVDAKVYADSYVIGAKNHQAFYEKNKNNPNAKFSFLDNTGKPTRIDGIPKLDYDRHELAEFAASQAALTAPPHVVRGATAGARIWVHG